MYRFITVLVIAFYIAGYVEAADEPDGHFISRDCGEKTWRVFD